MLTSLAAPHAVTALNAKPAMNPRSYDDLSKQELIEQLKARDRKDAVQWWHRNEVRKPWSVSMVAPDFVIGVNARKTNEGVLLADPKAMYDTANQAAKVLAQHPVYGKALIVCKTGHADWYCVVWNEVRSKAELGPRFEWDRAKMW
jgi:hypothetical protein